MCGVLEVEVGESREQPGDIRQPSELAPEPRGELCFLVTLC